MSDNEMLKPCPFCGTAPRMVDGRDVNVGYFVKCEPCALCLPASVCRDQESAARAWNTRAAAASAEPVDWHWRHRAPHNGAPWSNWKRIDGSIDDFKALWANHLAGAVGKTIVELRPLYTHPAPDAEIVAALDVAKNIIFGAQHQADRERNCAKSAEYQSYIDSLDAALTKTKGGSQ